VEWTVIRNVVKRKRHLSRSGPDVFQLPRLENGTKHIWDTDPFSEILNVADAFQKCKNKINRSSH